MGTVAQKLGITPGATIAVDGQLAADVAELLGELPDGVLVSQRTGAGANQVIVAANGLADLPAMLDGVWNEVIPGGRVWVWYRKGARRAEAPVGDLPLHRDTLQALLAEHGMDGVTLISVNDTWSAMRIKQL
jgi:hypothetical protein